MRDTKKKYTTEKGNVFKYDSGKWTVGENKILAVHTSEERMAEVIRGYDDVQKPLGGRTAKGIFTPEQAKKFIDNCHAWTPEGTEGRLYYFTKKGNSYQLRAQEISKIEKITQ